MPPKPRFTRDQIIVAGFDIVREHGWQGFSTRSLAARLGCSPMPIYSLFGSTAALEREIVRKIVAFMYDFMTRPVTGDPWHDHGIGYVLFALEESHLFRGINDEKHILDGRKFGENIWEALTALLADYAPFQGLTPEQVYSIQLKRWALAHGLAFHACTLPPGAVNRDRLIAEVREGSRAICNGLRLQFDRKKQKGARREP